MKRLTRPRYSLGHVLLMLASLVGATFWAEMRERDESRDRDRLLVCQTLAVAWGEGLLDKGEVPARPECEGSSR